MVFSRNDHPINNNIEAVRLQFANAMDTLPNKNKKTVLLWSSPLSMTEGVPKAVSLASITEQKPKAAYAQQGHLPLAVLLEGAFTSAYKNRVKPFKFGNALDEGLENKMLVVADGDIIKNQLRNGKPLELGYDKWTSNFYGNKEFLVNALNYMLDDTGLIGIRTKKVSIPLLDPQKIAAQKQKWQLLALVLPLVLVALAGFAINYIRKQKYGRPS